jgi:hypothetical protein
LRFPYTMFTLQTSFKSLLLKGKGKYNPLIEEHVNSKEQTPFLSRLRPRIRLLGTARKKALHNKCQSARNRPRLEFFSVSGLCYISIYI